MKRYLLFGGDDYYPPGGWSDFGGDFASIEEAKNDLDNDEWWQIVDTETKKIVAESN